MARKLKCAILGFGGMGHFHASQYAAQKDVELVALCDIDPAKLETAEASINLGDSGKSDLSGLRKYTSYEEMAGAEAGVVDMLDICLPAYLHADYSIRAMEDGFHVLCEKPMALDSRDCARMIAAQRKTGRTLMVAQCIRFNPAYQLLEKLVKTKRYGRLLKLDMYRYGNYPTGSSGWYMDANLSGGAIIDLHLHDLDWIQSALGKPVSLEARGLRGLSGGWDEVQTFFTLPESGAIVAAMGSWMRADRFQAGFTAIFEKAVLHLGGEPKLTDIHGKELKLAFKPANMYFNEIAYFAKCVKTGSKPAKCLPESTALTVRLIELERQSAKGGGRRLPVK